MNNPSPEEPIKLPIFRQLIPPESKNKSEDSKDFILFLVLLISAVLSMALLFYLISQSQDLLRSNRIADKHSVTMLNELHDLQSQLQQMAANTNNPSDIRQTVTTLANELATVEKSLADNAKSTDIKRFSDQLGTIQADLADLEQSISSQFNAKKYIDPKALPFQVNYLDMISGQPFVSVNYDQHVTPLGTR